MSKSSDKRKLTLSSHNAPNDSEQEASAIKRLDQPCPCQSGNNDHAKTYRECCRLYHKRQLVPPYTEPPTAEGLMRSRYTAFALGLTDYLMDTTHREHPEYRSNVRLWRKELQTYCQATQFHGLDILECEERERNLATVTFRAHLERQGQRFILQEKSVFVMIGTRWLYFAGETSTIKQES